MKQLTKLENILIEYSKYGVQCEILDYKSDYVGEKYLCLKGWYLMGGKVYFNFHNGRSYAGKNTSQFKPRLHPLPDLMKEIEHNGERFIPITKLTGVEDLSVFEITDNDIKLPKARCVGGKVLDWKLNLDEVGMLFNEYIVIQKLLEWHFDIFGLLDKNLAVDINTINR